jgi:hypothetical protein
MGCDSYATGASESSANERQSKVQVTSQFMMDFLEEISSFKVIQ